MTLPTRAIGALDGEYSPPRTQRTRSENTQSRPVSGLVPDGRPGPRWGDATWTPLSISQSHRLRNQSLAPGAAGLLHRVEVNQDFLAQDLILMHGECVNRVNRSQIDL